MKSRLDTVYLAVLLISFPGYALLVGVANLAGLSGAESSAASMIMRILSVGLAVLLILGSFVRQRDDNSIRLIQIFTVFWIAYFIRIFFDTLVYPDDLWQKPPYYWMWAVGGCFIPMLGLALWSQRVEEMDTLFRWFFCATFVACLLALLAASGAKVDNVGNVVETGRARIGDDRLNPISLGHLGAMLVIQSIWAFILFPCWQTGAARLFLFAALCVGQYVLIIANSRGPIVAAVGCLVIIIVLAPLRRKLWAILLSALVVASFFPLAQYVEDTSSISTSSRLVGTSITDSVQQSSRLDLFAGALEGFWESPWIGRSLEIPSVGGYPHNVIIESFMALGIVFGLLLLVGIVLLCLRGIFLFLNYPRYSWPSLLLFQYLIGAQFSGSLYSSTYLWVSIGLIASLQMQTSRNTTLNLTEKMAG